VAVSFIGGGNVTWSVFLSRATREKEKELVKHWDSYPMLSQTLSSRLVEYARRLFRSITVTVRT